jgi:prepilin-type N-terminal cleavage/methylation domain-containing protein
MKKRAAFTLVEIVMVIIILGIVGMIGTDILSHMYSGYIRSKLVNDLQQKTELVLDQITKRLQYRIKDTAIARIDTSNSVKNLSDTDITGAYSVLEWIGYDNESFDSNGWSGFIDVENSDTNGSQVKTQGSSLGVASSIISALSYGEVDLNDSTKDKPTLIFKCKRDLNISKYGLDYNVKNLVDFNNTLMVSSQTGSNDILEFNPIQQGKKDICEQYYLAWSAYAIRPEGSSDDFNLTLYYNYQPWEGEEFRDVNISKSVLAEHVSTFRFLQIGKTLRIKLCMRDGNLTGEPVGFCKEKAVF